ncbi:hypothetical protein A1D29_04170 [Pasteurellaceae bacterium Orientalotternb1]|nr:hypothetical protein A1D29_04170 [Pasteurellaceae bacterium Orientalotternb1]
MKLSTIALSVAVIIGATATGGSWYTGKQVEQRYQELVAQGNESLKQLSQHGIKAEIKNVNLERNFFTSDVTYSVEVEMDNKTHEFKGTDKIYHGPLPLNRLMKGNVIPVMASIDSKITSPEAFKEMFEQPEILVGYSNLSYSSTFDGQFKTAAFKPENSPFKASEIDVEFELAKSWEGKVNVTIPHLQFIAPEENIDVTFNQAQYDVSFPKEARDYPSLALGDVDVKIKSLVVKGTDEYNEFEAFELNDFVAKGKNKVANDFYEGVADFSTKLALVGKDKSRVELGKLAADMFMKSDAQATESLMKLTQYAPEELQSVDPLKDIEALTAKEIKFHLNNVSFENEKGKHTLSLVLNSKPFDPNTLFGLGFEPVLNVFAQSKLEGSINIAAFEELIRQLNLMNTFSKEDAVRSAKAATDELIANAQNSGLAVVDPDNIKAKVEIDQGKVKLNGNEVPEEQLQSVLFMLMLGLGGIGQ